MPFAAEQGTVRIDGVDYDMSIDQATGKPRRIEFNPQPPFPPVQATVAQFGTEQYGLNQRVTLTGRLSIGQRQGNDPTRCFDQHGVMAMFEGQITRGPQLQSPTISALPSTFKVTKGAGFFEGNGQLIVHGDGSAATNGEPLHYFVGSTTTWTDGTLNADLTADVENIVGVTYAEGRWWALADQLQSDGGNTRILYKSDGSTATPTVWERAETVGSNETHATSPFTPDRTRFLVFATFSRMFTTAPRFYSIHFLNASGRCLLTFRATDAQGWDGGTQQEIPSDTAPRGLETMDGPDGLTDIMASTNVGLFRGNLQGGQQTVEEIHRYTKRSGDFTGIMTLGGNGRLYILDGPRLKEFRFTDGNGASEVRIFNVDVPIEASGDFTAIAASKERPWIYLARGGLAASRNARIYIFDTELGITDPDHAWFCIHRAGTAQRAITALVESEQNDGALRLLGFVENAAGGDQDAFTLDEVTENPLEVSGWKYTDGIIEDSERDRGLGGLVNKIFLSTQLDADDLSSNEKVGFEHAHDGGSFNTEQFIDSSTSPARVYTDGASTAVGTKAKRQQVRWNLDGAEGATPGPSIKSVAYIHSVPSEKPDGTVPLEFAIPIMLDESDFKDLTGLSQRMTDINALLTGTLKTLRIGQTDVKVLFKTYQRFGEPKPPSVTANTQPELPGELVLIAVEPGE